MSSTTVDPPATAPVAGSDVFAEVLAAVVEQLGRVVEVPTFALDDGRLQARLAQALGVRARVEELVARLVWEVDGRNPDRMNQQHPARGSSPAGSRCGATRPRVVPAWSRCGNETADSGSADPRRRGRRLQ